MRKLWRWFFPEPSMTCPQCGQDCIDAVSAGVYGNYYKCLIHGWIER
jgi:predicted RNA-binding Zn-ribbon protein involved in translation (DUF1610 family)